MLIRSDKTRCQRFLGAALLSVGILFAILLPAVASPITYTLSGVSATDPYPLFGSIALTGTFTYDLNSSQIVFIAIMGTNTALSPLSASPEVFNTPLGSENTSSTAFISAGAGGRITVDEISIWFANPLTAGAPSAIARIYLAPPLVAQSVPSEVASGTVIPVVSSIPPIPEPTSLLLLGGALAALLFSRRSI
jgi:hypothetical protein